MDSKLSYLKGKKMWMFVIFVLSFNVFVFSQNLLVNPESVAYHEATGMYYVTCCRATYGKVVKIDENGYQELFLHSLNYPLGACIVGDVVYITVDNNKLQGYDVYSGDLIMQETLETNRWLDGITYDNNGHLYVIDQGRRLYKFNISDASFSQVATLENCSYPQAAAFDEAANRLLVCTYSSNAPVIEVDLGNNYSQSYILSGLDDHDGITLDQYRNIYIASAGSSGVFRFDPDMANPPVQITFGNAHPAGIYYNQTNDILAIPNYNGNSVDFVDMSTSINDYKTVKKHNALSSYNYPNPFNPVTNIHFDIPESSNIKLRIYNTKGQLIRTLINDYLNKGSHSVVWAGENSAGEKVGSDVYLYLLEIEGKLQISEKMILLK